MIFDSFILLAKNVISYFAGNLIFQIFPNRIIHIKSCERDNPTTQGVHCFSSVSG
jgi:hypothetical protein